MRRGKVKESILKRSVLRQLHTKSASGSPRYGEDAGMLPLTEAAAEGTCVAISVNPVEGWTLAAQRAVYGAVNSLAAAGAVPKSIAPVILMPEGTQERQLKTLMREMDALCEEEDIFLLGGHTAVSPAVKTLVLSVSAVGIRIQNESNVIQSGLDVVVAGTVGREGAAMIAIEREKELMNRFAISYIEQARHLFDDGSLRAAADLARAAGVVYIHDVREGGIFAGLWELAAAGKVGLLIDLKKIPIRQHTIEVCEHFRLNPYMLRSGGTMIMLCANGARVVSSLTEVGISAAVIGQTTEGNDRIIRYDDEIRYLEPPKEDEYYKICDID